MTPRERKLRRLVARCAASQFDSLTAAGQADILEGLALILPEEEAEEARHTLFLYRRAQAQQMELFRVLDVEVTP